MGNRVVVAGVGMLPFVKPGASASYDDMGAEAARLALKDAGIEYNKVEQAYVGWVYGDSTSGQAALYKVGLTGIPVVNVNNNCSTGSSALFLARQAVEAGVVDCAIALGFEQMTPGALGTMFDDRPNPFGDFLKIADDSFRAQASTDGAPLFGGAGYEYQEKFGAKTETFAKVREKASRHAEHNERAIFRKPVSVDDVMQSPKMFLNLTRLQCCPPSCGAAAALLCSEEFARKHGLDRSVVISAQAMTTDYPSTFAEKSLIKVVGADMTKEAARRVYEQAGIGPGDVDVVELHDCLPPTKSSPMKASACVPEGGAEKFVWDGDNTYGGKVVTNPSGGLLSRVIRLAPPVSASVRS